MCARLRAEGNAVPVLVLVLVLTAKNGEYDEAEGLDTGADDHLAKPFSYVVPEGRLRALLRRGGARVPVLLEAGDLWLDPTRRTCGRGNEPIALTPKESAVPHCLPGRLDGVVPAIDVLDEVWSAGSAGDPNLVHVRISAVRKKSDTPFGRRTVETVRGAGCRVSGRGRVRVAAPGTGFIGLPAGLVTTAATPDRAEAAATRPREFTADAAHGLRSPPASLRAQSESSLHHPESAALRLRRVAPAPTVLPGNPTHLNDCSATCAPTPADTRGRRSR
ncbi:hypothetical protein GCM10010363_40570 [Streptomyces omiyaensis]|uniref:response regulator transcription factor n=1 Tax=Streptomyces omiyaensis TaxID=68247 RepID=UPI00167AA3E0|nr:response regulator transcription factor [Streptomyces omiyaensis]GGY55107.1 hypothetical protein GCM10010363_40570 [Streptomyces omiyaensis]